MSHRRAVAWLAFLALAACGPGFEEAGQDASTLNKGPAIAVGQIGGFGQQADSVTITGLQQVAWSTSAGTFVLNGLDLHVSLSGEQCF